MREFVITTDSNCDMDLTYLAEHEVGVIPHYYTVDDEMYGNGAELTVREFYDAMREGRKAATMASNPEVIRTRFEEYAKQGKDILHISFSSALSSAYENIVGGARETMDKYPGMKIIVIDTLSASLGEGIIIRKAIELKEEGKTIEEASKITEQMVDDALGGLPPLKKHCSNLGVGALRYAIADYNYRKYNYKPKEYIDTNKND